MVPVRATEALLPGDWTWARRLQQLVGGVSDEGEGFSGEAKCDEV